MSEKLPPLIQALLEASRYPGAVQQVELVQTHISWVLLAGDFAYKIKKPVRLDFLDFSSLEKRLGYCQDELRLNQRYAPDIYLGVTGIFNTPQDPRFDGTGEAIEYAVKMNRFDEAGRLDRVCARGELHSAHLSDLAASLVAFHAAAATAAPASRFGSADDVMAQHRDNFTALLQFLPDAGMQTRLLALRAWTEQQFEQLRPLLEARKLAGRVRECHGDLHLANLVLIAQRVRMFDCIEFNEDLRWIDVASEIAFTFADLLAHRQPGLANWFVDEVLSHSGDYEAALVLRFYALYRTLVRAKVAAIRLQQTQDGCAEVLAWLTLAEHLVAPVHPQLVITHGLSGCGKTVASSKLLQSDSQASTLRLRSDVERKRLFGLNVTQHSGSATNAGIYAVDAHGRTYAHLLDQADRLLQAGWSVIVDATFLRRADRHAFQSLAKERNAAFAILAPQASPEQLRDRILKRSGPGRDASEATLEVLAQQMQTLEPLDAQERQMLSLPARASWRYGARP